MNYDLPHSPLMDAYIATNNKPNPYPDPEMVEQILNQETQLPFVDGDAYYYPGRLISDVFSCRVLCVLCVLCCVVVVSHHAFHHLCMCVGRNVTMGGVTSWRTNIFSLDCTEAEAMPANGFRPSTFMPPEKLVILTDGTVIGNLLG